MDIHIITLFPGMFSGPFGESIIKRAQEKGLVNIHLHNLRDFGLGKRKSTDDYPYGGGPGMVMRVEPIYWAVEKIKGEIDSKGAKGKTILLTPQGEIFTHDKAKELAREPILIFINGHYKGIDERIRIHLIEEELSIGDYILSGGELATMVVVDAIVRLILGVVGDEESLKGDSFYQDLLEGPLYTRPMNFQGMKVPDILVSGDHRKIRMWRKKEALRRTYLRRPELLKKIDLSEEDKRLLEEVKKEQQGVHR